jgi:hypothetical protein
MIINIFYQHIAQIERKNLRKIIESIALKTKSIKSKLIFHELLMILKFWFTLKMKLMNLCDSSYLIKSIKLWHRNQRNQRNQINQRNQKNSCSNTILLIHKKDLYESFIFFIINLEEIDVYGFPILSVYSFDCLETYISVW